MKGGRPLRFLAVTLGGWAAIRVAVLMPQAEPIPAVIDALVAPAAAAVAVATERLAILPKSPPLLPVTARADLHVVTKHPAAGRSAAADATVSDRRVRAVPSRDTVIAPPPPTLPLAPAPLVRQSNRWSASAWLLARGGAGGTVSGGQLGASQAGVRILYALGDSRRVALTARVATPLRGTGREAAIGLEWRPTRLPIRLIAEQRVALDGGRGGPTIGVIGGYGPAEIAPGMALEAYGQAGAIARDGIEGFVDAAARASHPVAQVGAIRFDVAVGAWASAQRGAERFDIGPSIGVIVPVAHRSLRLNLDWRQRIAGQARPGSGPALSIGSDF